MTLNRKMRIYWPDSTEVVCNESDFDCAATDDDRLISPGGRRVTVADLLEAIDEHVKQWHGEPEGWRPDA